MQRETVRLKTMNYSNEKDDTTISEDWYIEAFGPLYPVIYAHRTLEAAAKEVHFARRCVGLTDADKVLDLCCGTGRHLVALQDSGATLTGADYSKDLLRVAKKQLHGRTRLVRTDMRELPFTTAFDVLFNFFTSFGYFFEEADNHKTLGEMSRVLKTGGRFFMDYLNPQVVEATLVPLSEREAPPYQIREERWIDHKTRRVNKQVFIYHEGTCIKKTEESVRLYSLEEMHANLKTVGFRIQACLGDYDGSVFDPTSPRMILCGVKGDT